MFRRAGTGTRTECERQVGSALELGSRRRGYTGMCADSTPAQSIAMMHIGDVCLFDVHPMLI